MSASSTAETPTVAARLARDPNDLPADPGQYADLVALYDKLLAMIRDTDQISFKLLSFVPLVSGGGAASLTFLLENRSIDLVAVGILAVIGAATTYAVYRWELRNIDTCRRLWARATRVERRLGFAEDADRGAKPTLHGWTAGKSEAEDLIYAASILAWLVPIVVALAPAG